MSGSLIRRVTSESAIGYGVNVMEIAPPGSVVGAKTNVVGIVANLPWGPVDEVVECSTVAEFWDTFAPPHFTYTAATWPALLAFVNKAWPASIKVVRTSPSSQAAATYSWTVTGGTVVATAAYKGSVGNNISVLFSAATDGDSTHRDVVVSIGSTYSATYLNVTIANITAIDDPYVVFTKGSTPTALPAATTTNSLASGADGSAAAADWVGSSSAAEGLRLFYSASEEVSVVFCAGVGSGAIDTVNTGLKAFWTDTKKAVAVLCAVDGQTAAAARTYVASYRSDGCFYPYPRVNTTDVFDADLAEVEVDGAAFLACAIASVDPWESWGGPSKAELFSGVTSLENETLTLTDIDNLNADGIGPFYMVRGKGCTVARAVTTSTTSGLEKGHRRRMTSYLEASISDTCQDFVELPLDLELSSQTLGANTGALIGRITTFLQDHKDRSHLRLFTVDPFGGASQSDIDAGRWTILVTVKLLSMMEEIVLKVTAGERVNIVAA